MNKVLVIVVTHEGSSWMDACLGSVERSEVPLDAIVIDNASTDGTPALVRDRFPWAEVIENKENVGFGAANNTGLSLAVSRGYPFVYLLNQDAYLRPDTIGRLIRAYEMNPRCAVLSPLQLAADGSPDAEFERRCPRSVVEKGLSGRSVEGESYTVPRIMAAHWLLPVEAVKEIGGFAPIFPFFGEDDNWCRRARKKGWKVAVVPSASAVHDRTGRKESLSKIIFRNYYMGSLSRLCNPLVPLAPAFLQVLALTIAKLIRYRSPEVGAAWRRIIKALPQVKDTRMEQLRRGAFLRL